MYTTSKIYLLFVVGPLIGALLLVHGVPFAVSAAITVSVVGGIIFYRSYRRSSCDEINLSRGVVKICILSGLAIACTGAFTGEITPVQAQSDVFPRATIESHFRAQAAGDDISATQRPLLAHTTRYRSISRAEESRAFAKVASANPPHKHRHLALSTNKMRATSPLKKSRKTTAAIPFIEQQTEQAVEQYLNPVTEQETEQAVEQYLNPVTEQQTKPSTDQQTQPPTDLPIWPPTDQQSKVCPEEGAEPCRKGSAQGCPEESTQFCSKKDAKSCPKKDAKPCPEKDSKPCLEKDAKPCPKKDEKPCPEDSSHVCPEQCSVSCVEQCLQPCSLQCPKTVVVDTPSDTLKQEIKTIVHETTEQMEDNLRRFLRSEKLSSGANVVFWKDIPQSIQAGLTALGLILAGLWAAYVFVHERTYAGKIQIEIEPKYTMSLEDATRAIVFSVRVKNVGRSPVTKRSVGVEVVPITNPQPEEALSIMQMRSHSIDTTIEGMEPPESNAIAGTIFKDMINTLVAGDDGVEDVLLRFGEHAVARVEVIFIGDVRLPIWYRIPGLGARLRPLLRADENPRNWRSRRILGADQADLNQDSQNEEGEVTA